MKDVKNILSKDKLNRTELSLIYKTIKQLKLNIPWIDVLRKTTRGDVISKLKNKLEPKQQKYIVIGTIKITIRSKFVGETGATERITTSEEKYNETITATSKEEAIKKAHQAIKDMDLYGEDYEGGSKDIKHKGKNLRAVPHSKFKDVSELNTKMKNIINPEYEFFSEDKAYLKNEGYCVLDNIIGKYKGRARIKKKMNREWFIERCYEVADEGWSIIQGITPEMIQYVFKILDISVYAFDITKKCFSKYVCKNRNHPALVYYCINNHMYMISDDAQVQSMLKGAIAENKKINSSVFKDTNKKTTTNNIYDLPIYENIDIQDIDKYSNCLIIYTKSNINDEVEAIIKQYNIIPSNISSKGVNFLSCSIKDITLQVDPNYGNNYSWQNVKELCKGLDIEFKNQTFVSVIKSMRKIFYNTDNRIIFNKTIVSKVMDKSNNLCMLCRCTGDLEIDHIKPLCKGGTNNINNLQALCKGCHRTKTQREQETGVFIKEEETMSSFNCQTKEVINSLYAKSHAFVETLREPDDKYYYKMYKLDINKCRRNCLYYSKYEYPVFNVMDEVETYKGIKQPGLYFVESLNYIPLRGSGWYSQPMIEYCLEHCIIKESDIKYVIYSTSTLKKDYFNTFIDKLIETLSPFDTKDNKFSKLAINSIIGTFKPNEDRTNYKSMFMTTSPDNAFHHYLSFSNSVIDSLEIGDNTYYHVFKTSQNSNEETETPIYNMVLDMEAVLLHRLIKKIENNDGVVVDVMTDCATCYFKGAFPFKVFDDNNIDCLYYEKNKPIIKLESEYDYYDNDSRLKVQRMPKEKGMRYGSYNIKKPIWNIKEDVNDNDFTELVDYILDDNKSCNIDGRAGCGKSYLIKQLQNKMKEKGLKYISLAPTNKASNIINGQTIHRFVIQHSKKHLQDLDIDYIFIDEISMVCSSFYKFFSSLQRLKPNIKYIIVGDFKQLPPVSDKKEFDYKNSYVLWELCGGNRINLTTCRRSDDTLFNMLEDKNIMKLTKNDFNRSMTDIHICYTNNKRKEINKEMMKQKSKDKKHVIKLDAIPTDDRTQDVLLYVGCPVIAKKNCKNKGFVNNDQFSIKHINEEYMILEEAERTIEIKNEDFQRNFCVAYCITTHSSQGATIDKQYTIHEFDKMDKRLRYVSLSRSTDKNNINIM